MKKLIILYLFFNIFGCNSTDSLLKSKDIIIDINKENNKHVTNKVKKCNFYEDNPKPEWIDWIKKPPGNKCEFLYGIGIAPQNKSLDDQITVAKARARVNLSEQISLFITSYSELNDYCDNKETITSFKWIINEKTSAIIYDCKNIEIWKDNIDCNLYVLMKVRKNKIVALHTNVIKNFINHIKNVDN